MRKFTSGRVQAMSTTALFLAVSALLVSDLVPVAPAEAQTTKAKPIASPPPLPSAAPAEVPPTLVPAGDLTDVPPHPDQQGDRRRKAPVSGFDAARSTFIEAETTPTRRVAANPDGTRTVFANEAPVRFKDASGTWRDIDLSLLARPDGALAAKSSAVPARLGAKATGDLATLDTPAGPIVLRQPAALPASAVIGRDAQAVEATYAKALPGGRDLVMSVTNAGIKENVVLPDRVAPSSYVDELVLPAGVSARTASEGIELIDAKGAVVAIFAAGLAHDSSFPAAGPAAASPVRIKLLPPVPSTTTTVAAPVSATTTTLAAPSSSTTASSTTTTVAGTEARQIANVARIEVSVDPEWMAGPRRFPITIDPSLIQPHASAAENGRDTFVARGANGIDNTTTDFSTWPTLYTGNNGQNTFRTLLDFNTTSGSTILPSGDVQVLNATVWLYNSYSPSCNNTKVTQIAGLAASPAIPTTWNNQPAMGPVVSGPAFAWGGPTCPGNQQTFDVTSLAQSWASGGPRNGIGLLAANEADLDSFRVYHSSESGIPSAFPTLVINFNRRPAMPTAAPSAPADGEVITYIDTGARRSELHEWPPGDR